MNNKKNHKQKAQEEKVDINKLSKMSGEDELKQAPKYLLSSLKMNGNEGVYYRTILKNGELQTGDDGKALLENVGKSITGIFLKVRKTFVQNDPETQLFSSEVSNSQNAQVSVFNKSENAKGKFTIGLIFQGTAAQVKERFPEISMVSVIYTLLPETNEIVRLKVKGASLSNLFAYWKNFESSEHIFEFITKMGSSPESNKFGKYYVATFARTIKSDLKAVQIAMEEVHTKLAAIDEFYKGREVEVREEGEEIPIIEKEEKVIDSEEALEASQKKDKTLREKDAEDDIDVKDIPL